MRIKPTDAVHLILSTPDLPRPRGSLRWWVRQLLAELDQAEQRRIPTHSDASDTARNAKEDQAGRAAR